MPDVVRARRVKVFGGKRIGNERRIRCYHTTSTAPGAPRCAPKRYLHTRRVEVQPLPAPLQQEKECQSRRPPRGRAAAFTRSDNTVKEAANTTTVAVANSIDCTAVVPAAITTESGGWEAVALVVRDSMPVTQSKQLDVKA